MQKTISSVITIITAMILWCIALLQPTVLLAAGEGLPRSGDEGTGSAFNLLSTEDQTALTQGQEIDVIVEFDQTEAVNIAATRRLQASLQYDDDAILAERVQSYRRQKERSLATLSGEQITIKQDYSHLPMVFAQMRSPAALQTLLNQPGVKAVYSNVKSQLTLAQSLPLIRQPETAAQGGTGTGVTVAVLDTGVNYTSAAFGSCAAPGGACKVAFAADFALDDGQRDDVGHGTNVAGIVLGVAPGARIAALDVCQKSGQSATCASDVAIRAIDWVIANKAAYNIVAMNLSFGGGRYGLPCITEYTLPIANARTAGILAAISSGNDGFKDSMGSPACVPAAVSVGAVYDSTLGGLSWRSGCTDSTTQADQVTCFSNSAGFLTLLAPGAKIRSADIEKGGTSQAAPHVAGAIAVLRAAYPNESLDTTVARLTSTGVRITDRANGITKPRINLLAAYTANRSDYPLTISKSGTGSGTVTSNPAGINCGNTCSADFAGGTSVTLTATPTPNSSSTFAGWSGACSGTGTCTVTMNAARSVTAAFTAGSGPSLAEGLDNSNLTWQTGGDTGWHGVTLSDRDAAQSGDIGNNQFSELRTTVTGPGTLSFQWKVSSESEYDDLEFWLDGVNKFSISGEVTWQTRTVTIGAGVHEVKWIFRKDGSLSRGSDAGWVDAVTFTPSQSGSPDLIAAQVTSPANGAPGGAISVSATVTNQGGAAAGRFRLTFLLSSDSNITLSDVDTGWGCDFDALAGGNTATCSGEIDIPASTSPGTYYLGAYADSGNTVTEGNETNNGRAADNPIAVAGSTFPLTVTLTGNGSGKVSSSPGGIDCGVQCNAGFASGTSVTLTTTPVSGSTFAGWGGACSGTGTCTVTMTAARSVTAAFNAGSGSEGFPPNGNWPTGWTTPATSNAAWIVTTDWSSEGRYSLRSGSIGNNQKSQVQISGNFQAGTVSFVRRVSSEGDFDWLSFYIDGVEQNGWSGETGTAGAQTSFPLAAGNHTLMWSYEKDSSLSSGSDAAWIDGVSLPPLSTGTPLATSSLIFSGDYNGDGKADVVWHHSTSGYVYGMLLNSLSIAAQGMFYYEPNTAWRIIGNGDFNGDHQSDLLWWNSQIGQVYLMVMNGLDIAGGTVIYQEPDLAWRIVAVGDLNRDGRVDLIWRNSQTGYVYGMLMNGASILQGAMFYHEADLNWGILAARDFTGDGKADLLWRNGSTGHVYLMVMDGLTITGGAMVYQEADLAWRIVAVGDLNGDGKADLVWWNNQTGQVYGMLMNGAVIAQRGMVYQEADTAWHIVAFGDYNGDGKADLLWRHNTAGQIYEMLMNGLNIIGGAVIYQEANADWRIVANAPPSLLPGTGKSLVGGFHSVPLAGEPLNAVMPWDGDPVNPYQPMDGELINPAQPLSE